MLRYFAMLAVVALDPNTEAAEAVYPPTAVQVALATCASMQERFVGTECSANPQHGGYALAIKAANPDAMRVVFMRSLDVADALCNAGNKVSLSQQLETSAGTRVIRWAINPKGCSIKRLD